MLSRVSSSFARTLREDPAGAEVPSHRLLVRAGCVRRVAAGIYTWLPLGVRELANVTRVMREEMERIGGQESVLRGQCGCAAVVGRRAAEGVVEVRDRSGGTAEDVALGDAVRMLSR